MKLLQNLNVPFKQIAKVIGLVLLIAIALIFLSSLTKTFTGHSGLQRHSRGFVGGMFDGAANMAMDMEESVAGFAPARGKIAPEPSYDSYGDDAESFEVTEYSASIRTGKAKKTCNEIAELKRAEEVIFENASTHDTGCNFRFKVKNDAVERVLETIKDFKPEHLNENTYSIAKGLQNLDSQSDILKKKLQSIESTLEDALNSYDEISRIATSSQNAEALASIVDSKVRLIERLTQERMNINAQLDRLAKQQSEQLDRLSYTFFSVNVYESKFVDIKQLKNAWRTAIQQFVFDANEVLQGLTVKLVLLLLWVLQYGLYLLLLLFVVKFGWKHGKRIWES